MSLSINLIFLKNCTIKAHRLSQLMQNKDPIKRMFFSFKADNLEVALTQGGVRYEDKKVKRKQGNKQIWNRCLKKNLWYGWWHIILLEDKEIQNLTFGENGIDKMTLSI